MPRAGSAGRGIAPNLVYYSNNCAKGVWMKGYTITVSRGEEGWESSVEDLEGIPIDGIFGMGKGETKQFSVAALNRVFDLLSDLDMAGPCE